MNEDRSLPRVALIIETTRTYTRDILSGVRKYLATNKGWSCYVELRALDSDPPPWLRNWDGDGILTRTHTQEMANLIAETGLPTVELRSTDLNHNFPFVGMDNALIGRTVADHFLTRGYRHFAAYQIGSESFFRDRNQNFIDAVRSANCDCRERHVDEQGAPADWDEAQDSLIEWLRDLPKPVGLFATNDSLAVRILDACTRAGIRVPEEIAVVGTENEETLCTFASPQLTSIAFDGEAVGFRAAEILDDLMAGKPAPDKPSLIPPRGIVLRQSSDELMMDDRLVARALQIIRDEVFEGITVSELCRRLSTSRSTLERRMKAAIGRNPKAELQRLQFRRVEELLRFTTFTIEDIAQRCGFSYAHYLQSVFRERYGMTPNQFRKSGFKR